jgi:crotonobetainyl-CoA:carnitine CoA-transferase CaiB-like acyl-CoA transferase
VLPLAGVSVVELGSSLGAAFCGKVLAELGADVLLLERPEGSPARHLAPYGGGAPDRELAATHLYTNAGKQSAVLDLGTSDAAGMVHHLIASADVVVHGLLPGEAARLGLMPAEALSAWPGVIFGAVTPFGLEGPWAGFPAAELTIAALDGYMFTTGDPGRQPLANFGHEVEFVGGQVLAAGVLAALRARESGGRGDYVDIALSEANNAALDAPVIGGYEYLGRDLDRKGNLTGAFGPLRTKDGFVYVAPIQETGYQGLLIAAGRPDLLDDPRLADWDLRLANREILEDAVQSWSRERSTLEVLEAVQEMRVPSAIAESMQQLLDDPQIAARGLLRQVDHPKAGRLLYPGAPFLSDALDFRTGRAPLLGEHQALLAEPFEERACRRGGPPGHAGPRTREDGPARRKPLEGIRVVDLTQVWAGPFATVMLAELGADVIHIESPTRPDMTRFWTVNLELEGDLWEKSAYFNQHNRAKRSLILNLAYDSARDVVRRLTRESDIVINNYSRRVMENWGFTYEAMREENARVVYVTMPSYGATGPQRDYVSFGDSLQAASGMVRWRGYGPEEPRRAGSPMPDPYSAYTVTALILAALRHRDATGRPVYIDLAQRDASLRMIGDELVAYQLTGQEPHQFNNEHREWAPHRVYRCAGDDNWVAIAVRSDEEWQALCRVMRRPALAADSRFATADGRRKNRGEIDAAVEAWAGGREAKWIETMVLDAGVPAGVVQRASEILRHPQFVYRGFFPWVSHPVGGDARLHTTPIYLHGQPGTRTGRRAPLFGEHTHEILAGLLGLTASEIAALEAEGAAGGVPDISGVQVWAE